MEIFGKYIEKVEILLFLLNIKNKTDERNGI